MQTLKWLDNKRNRFHDVAKVECDSSGSVISVFIYSYMNGTEDPPIKVKVFPMDSGQLLIERIEL